MSSVFARLGLCALLLLTIKGLVQGFPTEDSSGSNEVDLAQNNANETVDGKWDSWNSWSVCSATCGPTGVRTRHRECKPPLAERYGGKDCDGPNHQTEGCNSQHCPVDGGWANWSDWSESSATCGSFKVFRTRTCTNPEPKYGGRSCSGPNRKREWRTHRVVHCPIHGCWSLWSSWSSYSVTCGKPVVERTRSCTNPRPQYGGQNCNGKPRNTKVVDTRVPCPIHGGWSEWQARTKCPPSKMLWEIRSCTNPRPQHNGRLCNGTSQRQVPCEPIRVHGAWCPWGAWGRCSSICYISRKDEQFRTRHRKCECPKPENGGQDCGRPKPDTSPCAVEDVQPCNPPTRAPCKKTTTADYGGGYDYGNDYGNDGGGNAEVTTAGPQYGNYGDYDC